MDVQQAPVTEIQVRADGGAQPDLTPFKILHSRMMAFANEKPSGQQTRQKSAREMVEAFAFDLKDVIERASDGGSLQPEKNDDDLTRVDGVPEGEHGDLPRPPVGAIRALTEEDIDILLISAVRYALGRQSYIVGLTCDLVRKRWGRTRALVIVQSDIIAALERAEQEGQSLGMEMDHREWQRLALELESGKSSDAVDPHAADPGKLTTRERNL